MKNWRISIQLCEIRITCFIRNQEKNCHQIIDNIFIKSTSFRYISPRHQKGIDT